MNRQVAEESTVVERYSMKKLLLLGGLLFCVIMGIYLLGLEYNRAGDTKPYELLPVTLLVHGDFDYNEFWFGRRELPYYYKRVNGKLFSAFNIIPGLINVPVFAIAHYSGIDIMEHRYMLSKITATLLSTMTVVVLFFCLSVLCKRIETVIIFTFVFALCTCMWSLASTGLWKQTVTLLFCSTGILCFLTGRKWLFMSSGLFFASAIIIRPPLILYVIPCFVFLLIKRRKVIPYFLLGTMIVGIGMLFYSYHFLGFKKEKVFISKISFGLIQFEKDDELARPLLDIRPSKKERKATDVNGDESKRSTRKSVEVEQSFWRRNGLDNNVFVGMGGILISPSRGLFFYSPILLFGVGGLILSFRKTIYPLLPFLSFSILLYYLLLSFYQRWYGGCSFGYRLLLETVPILVILSAIFWERYCFRRVVCHILLGLCIAYSAFIQYLGVYYYPSDFCYVPNRIDYNHERLWDFPDTEITRLLRMFITDMRGRF